MTDEGKDKEHFEWYRGYSIKYSRSQGEWVVYKENGGFIGSFAFLVNAEGHIDTLCNRCDCDCCQKVSHVKE